MASEGGGDEGDSKIIKEARAKLNASLSIDDPLKIKAVLEDSEEFGDVVEIERKALHEKYDGLVKEAVDTMKEVAGGDDFADMMETMAKYEEKYNYEKTDKYDSAQEAFTELRTKWDTLLEATKEKLRALMSETDPKKIDEGLEEYELTYGVTIESEVKALQERKQTLFRTAGTEMQALAAKSDATIEQFDELLDKYKDWGEDVRLARDALMSSHRLKLADIARDVGELTKGKDFKAVEELLTKYDAAMEKHMKDKKDELIRHKESLVTTMKDRLQKAANLTVPAEIDVVLKDSEQYGETVSSERDSLQKTFDDVISNANKEMSDLVSADYTKFKEMTEAMTKYEEYPGEETKKLWSDLQKHWDEVLEGTKKELRDLVATTDPNKLTEEVKKFDGFESTIDEERSTLQKRRTQLLDECKTEMSSITAKVAPQVPEINACLEKYKDYPEDINSVRDQLKNKKAQVLTDVKDQLQLGMNNEQVIEVDKILRTCEHAKDEEDTKQPYEELTNYRKTMKEGFGEKMLKGAQDFKDPGRLMQLISDSAQYGESIESERGKVQDALKSVLDEAIKEMDGLNSSEDFGALTMARKKFSAFPDGEPRRTPDGEDKTDVKEAKEKLQAHYNDVLEKTKASMRELSSSSDPVAIDAKLKEVEVYKDTINDERELVNRRRGDLIHSAKQELQLMQANRTATRADIDALLEKYKEWPDIRKEKDALRSKISMLMVGATDALNKAAASTDVEEIDRVLAMPDLTGEISADLKEAVEKANAQRKTLADEMTGKMKDAQSNDATKEDPKKLAEILEESKIFGESIDSDRSSMESYIEGLFKGAKDDMAKLVKEGEFKEVDEAVTKYTEWSSEEIKDDLGKLRARWEQIMENAKSGLLDGCALSDPIKIREVLKEHEKFGPAVEREREQVMRRIETIHDVAAKEMMDMASRKVVTEAESSVLLEKYAEWGNDPVHPELKKARDALRSKQALLATGTMDRLRRLGAVEEDPEVLNNAIEEFKERAEELGDAYTAITSRRDQLKDEMVTKINDAKALDDPVEMARVVKESETFGELVEKDREGLKEDMQKLYKTVSGDLEKLATATEVDFKEVEAQCEKYKKWPEEHQTEIKDALATLDKKRDELITAAKEKILELCGEADPIAIANGLVEFEDYGQSLDEQRRTAVTRRQFLITQAQTTIRNLSTNKNATLVELEACLEKYKDYPEEDVGTERLALQRAKNRMHSREADVLSELRRPGDGPPDIEAIDAALKRYADREEASKEAGKDAKDGEEGSKLPELPLELLKEVEALQAYRKQLEDDEKKRLTDALKLEDPRDIASVILTAEMMGAQGREEPKEEPWKEFEELNKHVEKLYTDAKDNMKKLSEAKEDEVDFKAVYESLQKYEQWPQEQFAEELKEFKKKSDELVVEAKGKLLTLVEMSDPNKIKEELDKYVDYGEAVAPERDAATQRRQDILDLAMRNMETLAANPQATVVEIQKMERKYADFGTEVRTARDMLKATGRRVLTASKDRFAVLVLGDDVKQIDAWIKLHTGEPDTDEPGDKADEKSGSSRDAGAKSGAGAEGGDGLVPKELEEEMEKLKKHREELQEAMKKRIEEATDAEQKDPKVVSEVIEAAEVFGESLTEEVEKAKSYLEKLGSDGVSEIEGKVTSDDLDDIVACIETYTSASHGKDVKDAVAKLEARRDELVGDKKMKLLELVSKNDPNEITKGLDEIFGVEEGSGKSYMDSPAAKYVKIEIDAAKSRWQGLIDEAKRTITVLLHPDRNATLQEVEAMQARFKDYPEEAMRDKMDALKSKEVLLSSSLKDTLRGLVEGSDFKAIVKAIAAKPEKPADADADAKDGMAEFYEKLEARRDKLKEEMQEKMKEAESGDDPAAMQELLATAESDYGEAVESETKSLKDSLDKKCEEANKEMSDLASATPEKDQLKETFEKTEEALLKYAKWPKETEESYAKLKEAKNTMIDKAKDELLNLCASSNPVEITENLPAFEAFGSAVDQEYTAAAARRKTLAQNANEDMQKLAMNNDAPVPDIEAMITKYEEMFPEGDHDCRKDILQSTTLLRTVITNRAASASDKLVQLTKSEDIQAIDKMLKENEGSEQVKEALESLTKHRDDLVSKLRDEISALSEETDPAAMIPTLVKGELFGESAEKEVSGLAEKITGKYRDALSEAKEISEKEDDPTKVAQTINKYEPWPRDDVPASIKEPVTELHKSLDGLRERRDQLVGDVKVKLMETATSEDIVAIDELLENTEPLAAQATVERRALQSRREALVSRAKTDMGVLSRKSDASALEISRALEKYKTYKPEDVRNERDGLKAKQTLVYAETKDRIKRLIESAEKDTRIIDKALNDPYDGYQVLNEDGTPSEETVLKEVLEQLKEYKEKLKGGVKERLAEYEKLEKVEELQALLDETEGSKEGLESERKAVQDKLSKIWDEANVEMTALCKSQEFKEVEDGLKKYESYGGPTEARWNSLNLHREEMVDSVKIHLIELMKSTDALEIAVALDKYEPYSNAILGEQESLRDRQKTLYNQVVSEMQTFAVRSDVSYADVQGMIDKYSEYPKEHVRLGQDALTLKMKQMYASVGDKLSFLLETKDVAAINETLKEVEGLGDAIKDEREKLEAHKKTLQEDMSKRLVAAVQLESPKDMQVLLDEAQAYGEEIKTESRELKRKLDIVVATAQNDMKALMASEDFRSMSQAVKTYEGFHADTQADWEALRARWRREAGNAKSRLQRVATSNDPNEVMQVVESFASAESILGSELADARDRYAQLIEMANTDMLALARSPEPTIKEIEKILYRYDKYPMDIEDSRVLLKKKSNEIAQSIEAKIDALAASEDLNQVSQALAEYGDAGDRFVHSLAALKKRRNELLDEIGAKFKAVMNADNPMDIAAVLDDAVDYGEDLRVERAALVKRKRELIEGANEKMQVLMSSEDFPAISAAIDAYESWGDATATAWAQLREHWMGQLDQVKKNLRDLCAETQPTVIDEFLRKLDGMDPEMLSRIDSEMQAAQARRDGLIESATDKIRELSADDRASIVKIEEALEKFSTFPGIDAALSGLEGAKEQAIARGQEELKAMMDSEDVAEIDKVIAKHKKESGLHLDEMVEDLADRRRTLMQKLFDQIDEVSYSDQVAKMKDLIIAAEQFGPDAAEQMAFMQRRREEVVATVIQTLQMLARSNDFGAIAAAMAKYEDFSPETTTAYEAVKDRWDGLVEMAKTQLEALAMSDDPAQIATGLKTYAAWGGDLEASKDNALRRQTDLLEQAKEFIKEMCENPDIAIKDVEEAIMKYAPYPEIDEENAALAMHLSRRVAVVQDQLAILRESDDIAKVDSALSQHKGTSDLIETAVRDLEHHMVGLGRRMADRLQKLLKTEDLDQIDQAIADSMVYGETVEDARDKLSDHRRKILRLAAEEIAELTLSDDFLAVQNALFKYKDWPEETQQHVEKLENHRKMLIDRVKTILSGLRSAANIDEIDGELVKYEPFKDEIAEEIEFAEKRKQELFEDATKEMETLAKDESKDIVQIEEMIAKYESYPNDIRRARDQLKTELAKLVAKVREELRTVVKSNDFKAVAEQLDKYAKTPSTQIAGVVAELRERQDNLIVVFCQELEKGKSLESPVEIDELLEKAQAYEGMPGIKQGTKALQARRVTQMRASRQHIKKMSRSQNFREISEAVDKYEKFPEDIKVEWESLKTYRDQLAEEAKARLKELVASDDPTYLQFELEKYEAFGDLLGPEIDEVEDRKSELVKTALEQLEQTLADEATDMKVIGEKLIEYGSYPGIDTMRMKLQTKLDDLVASGKGEIIKAMDSSDVELVSKVLEKHESSGEYLDAALQTLEQHRDRLEQRLLERLGDTMSGHDIVKVKAELQKVEHLKENPAFASMIAEVQTHFDSLRQEAISKLDEALSQERPTDVATMLLDTSLTEVDEDIRVKFDDLRARYIELTDLARDKLVSALGDESPEQMKQALDDTTDFKVELEHERKNVAGRRASLIDGVNKELRAIGMQSDFKALGEALEKYKNYAPETLREWNALQRRNEDVVENAKKSLRDLQGSKDPGYIDDQVKVFEQFGELVDQERTAAIARRNELIEGAKSEMQALAGADVSANVKKIADALNRFRMYPDEADSDRKVLDEMLRGVVKEHDELLRHALRSDDVQEVDNALAKCKTAALEEYLGQQIEDTKRYRFKLEQQMGAKVRLAIQGKDLKMMTETLAAIENFGDKLETERIALQSHYKTTQAAIKKDLRGLCLSKDYKAVVATVKLYTEPYPVELESEIRKLHKHQEDLLQSAKDQLVELVAAATPMHIDEQLPKFDVFGPELDGERAGARTRREDLCERASKDMEALADPNGTSTLREIELCLEQHELYPKEVRGARDALKTRQAVKAAKLRERLKESTQSPDYQLVSGLLEEIGDSAGVQLSSVVADLKEHQNSLVEAIKLKMKSALQYEDPRDLDSIMEEATPFGDRVKNELALLVRRKGNLMDGINKQLKKLTQIDDVDAVSDALDKYKDFSDETNAEWQSLHSHREALVERARGALRDMVKSSSPAEILACMERYSALDDLVADEKEQAQAHYFELMDEARLELIDAINAKEVDIPLMSEIVAKYEAYPREINDLRQQLRGKITRAVNQGADAIMNALHTKDITAIDACLGSFGGTHGNFQEQLADLKTHRDRLLRDMVAKMSSAVSMSDPHFIRQVLKDAEPYGAEVDTERKMLEDRRESLRDTAVADMDAAIASDDFKLVSLALKKYSTFADEVPVQFENLRQTHEDIIEIAKANARDLLSVTDPKDIDSQMESFEYYGEVLAAERQALNEARFDIVQGIKKELLATADESIEEIERVLEKYVDYSAEDIGRERRRLEAALQAKAALMEEKMSQLRRTRDIKAVDEALSEFGPYETRLEDSFVELRRHRERLIERICENLMSAVDLEDPKRIMEILEESKPFDKEVEKERGVLRERYETLMRRVNDKLELLLQSDDYTAVLLALKQQEGHAESLSSTVRALEVHATELVNRCKTSLTEVCARTDLPQDQLVLEISRVIEESRVFKDEVKELRMEAEIRLDELYEIAATDMDSWAHDMSAAPWLLSEILQKYPSSAYPTDERVVRARNALQEKLATTITALSETMYSKLSSTNVASIDTFLLTHRKDSELVPEAYRELQTHRQKLTTSLHTRIKAALEGEDIWVVSKLIYEVTDAGMVEEKASLEEKRSSIIETAARSLTELKSLDDYPAIAAAVEKYSELMYRDVGQALEDLREHERSLLKEAQTFLRERAQRETDPTVLTEVIEKYAVFGDKVEEQLHACRIRRVNLIEAARRELQSMKYRQGLTVDDAEKKLEKYEAFGQTEFKAEMDGLHERIAQMVAVVADETARTKYSDNIQTVEAALIKNEQLLSKYMPDVLADLRGFKAEMLNEMRTEVQSAMESSDPRIMQERLVKVREQGFQDEGKAELESLETAIKSANKLIDEELKLLMQSEDYPDVLKIIEKYENKGYSDEVTQSVDALKAHRDILRRSAARRIREKTAIAEDPKELAEVIKAHADYREACMEQMAEAEARRMTLFQDAKTKMQLLLQDPHASIEQMTKVYNMFADFSFEVRNERTNLQQKIERVTADTEKQLRDATAIKDVHAVDALLAAHEVSREALEPAYGALTHHRLELTRRLQERMVLAASQATDPWEIDQLLQEAIAHGEEVEQEKAALRARYEFLIEQAIDEMHSLVEQDDNFQEIFEAVRKYEHYPRVCRSAWQALRQHQKILINAAKQELQDAAKSTDVGFIAQTVAKFDDYGDEIEGLAEIARERENQLYQDAEDRMSTLLHAGADDASKRASTRDISQALQKYSEYKSPRVDDMRKKLHDILGKQLRSADLQLRDVMRTEDVHAVDVLLRQYADHGEELSHVIGEVQAHRESLKVKMHQQLTMASASDDPRKLWATIEASRQYGEDLAAPRSVVTQRYSMIVENVIRHIKTLTRSEDYASVVNALDKYADYPAQEFKLSLEALKNHHEDLLAGAKGELGRLTRSDSPLEIDSAITHYSAYGAEVTSEIQTLRAVRRQLIESARREMSTLAATKASTTTQIEAALEKYTNYPVELNDVRRVLIERLESTRTVKQQLLSHRAAVEPGFILREVQRHEIYGPAVDEERAVLQKRVNEITEAARIEMENLVRDPHATVITIERALDKYASYPDSLTDIRAALSAKFDQMLSGMRKDVNRTVGGADIHKLNSMMQQFSGTTNLARDLVSDLEQQRLKLADELVSRMKDALLSPDPVAIADLMEESMAYGDNGDVVAFRRGLVERHRALLDAASAELRAARESSDYTRVDATLRRFENYPPEVKPRWVELDEHRNRLVRDVVRDAQSAMQSTSTQAIDATLNQLNTFGDKFVSYKHLLHSRRSKVLADSQKVMQQALETNDIMEVDRICSAHVHLVGEIEGSVWKQLRDHRQNLIVGLKQQVQSLLQKQSLVELDAQMELISVEGLRQELHEEIEQLRDHRAYLTQEADASLGTARQAAASRSFELISAELEKLIGYGFGDRPEAHELAQRKEKLTAIAKKEMAAAASSSNAHLIKATLERFASYGDDVATERHALAVCLQRLEASAREMVEQAERDGTASSMKAALVRSETFHAALAPERDALSGKLQELQQRQQEELEGALRSEDMQHVVAVVKTHAGSCTEELTSLYAQVEQRMETKLTEMREHLLEGLGWTNAEHIDRVAQVLANYRGQVSGMEELGADWDALEGHYRRLMLAGKKELTRLLQETDPMVVETRLAAFSGVQHFAPEIRRLRLHSRTLLRDAAQELVSLVDGIDAVAINAALKKYAPVEGALQSQMDALRSRRSELAQRASDRNRLHGELGGVPDDRPVVAPDGRVLHGVSAQQELSQLLSVTDMEAVEAALAKYPDSLARRLGGGVPTAVQKLRTHHAILRAQAGFGGGTRAVQQGYKQLRGAEDRLARLEAERSTLSARVAKVAHEAKMFEEQVEEAAAVSNVLELRVQELRQAAAGLPIGGSAATGAAPGTGVGVRRCPACREVISEGAEFREHVQRCVHQAVDFSVRRALGANQSAGQRVRPRRGQNTTVL